MKRDGKPIVAKMTLILSFGELLSSGQAASKYPLIAQQMRQTARLLMQLRENKNKPEGTLESFLKQCFDTVVEAELVVANYEEAVGTGAARLSAPVPSLALMTEHSIQKCCSLLVNKALREKDEPLESFVRVEHCLENNER